MDMITKVREARAEAESQVHPEDTAEHARRLELYREIVESFDAQHVNMEESSSGSWIEEEGEHGLSGSLGWSPRPRVEGGRPRDARGRFTRERPRRRLSIQADHPCGYSVSPVTSAVRRPDPVLGPAWAGFTLTS